MSIIDPSGLFGGDRLRRCSNVAQLHWPRLFLASDGFARLEMNYARIIGRAYPTFNPHLRNGRERIALKLRDFRNPSEIFRRNFCMGLGKGLG